MIEPTNHIYNGAANYVVTYYDMVYHYIFIRLCIQWKLLGIARHFN